MVKLEAVLFDLDGTLLDSAHDITQGLNKMLVDDGRAPLDVAQIKPMLGDGAMELCRRALTATGGCTDDDLFPYVQKFIKHYRKIDPDPAQVFPGVCVMLKNFQAKGIKLAVCTNKPDEASHEILKLLKLDTYFDFIAGGDTFQIHKPHPGHITGILDKIGASVQGTLFVGDGPADVGACQRAGVPCIIMTHGYGQDYEALKTESDAMVDSFDDFIPVIEKLGFEIN